VFREVMNMRSNYKIKIWRSEISGGLEDVRKNGVKNLGELMVKEI